MALTEEQDVIQKMQGLTVADTQKMIHCLGFVCQNAEIQDGFKRELGLLLMRYGINCLEQVGASVQAVIVHPEWAFPMTHGTNIIIPGVGQQEEVEEPPLDDEDDDEEYAG